MKIILLIITLSLSTFAFSQVGIGTTNPNANAILDLTATNKAIILPRVANSAAIPAPVNGMMIYDISSNCVKSYENGVWTDCWSSNDPASPSVSNNCDANGFEGGCFNGF